MKNYQLILVNIRNDGLYYEILKVMSDWLVKKGIKRNDAQKYITTLFLALSEDSSQFKKRIKIR